MAVALAAILALAASPAAAQSRKPGEPPPPPDALYAPPAAPQRTVGLSPFEDERPTGLSLTLSPFHLSAPVLRLSAEVGLDDKVGVMLTLAAGKPKAVDPHSAPDAPVDKRVWLYEVAAQARYYVLGNFLSGAMAGVDASYTAVNSDQLLDMGISNTAAGLGIAPLLGFKVVTRIDLTFDIMAGPKFLLFKPTPSDVTPDELANKPRRVLVLVNAQIGWTF